MKPIIHAKNSARKHGGKWEDYIEIHNFLDSSKVSIADLRHRALLHNTFGCFLVERVFGIAITNSDGKTISTREIAEEHVVEDMGYIPTVENWFESMPILPWMKGGKRKYNSSKFEIID